MGELLTLDWISTVDSVDKHIGFLVRRDVATDILAEHLRIAIDIEEVILQLESQANLLTRLIEI